MNDNRTGHFYGILIVVFFAIFVFCVVFSAFFPRLDFDVALRPNAKTGGELVVTKRAPTVENLRRDDIIEAVNGKPVSTRAEFYFQLILSGGESDLTVKRLKTQFQRELSDVSFSTGEIPLGLRKNDVPIGLMCEGGEDFVPLEGVNFDSLREIVSARSGGAIVVFRRPEDLQSVSIKYGKDISRTLGMGATLVFLLLMMGIWHRSSQRRGSLVWTARRNTALSISILLGCVSVQFLAFSLDALAVPPLFILLLVGFSAYKAVDIEFHRYLRFGDAKAEKWKRAFLYLFPALIGGSGVVLALLNMGILWGAGSSASMALREVFVTRLLGWMYLGYVLADFALMASDKAASRRKSQPLTVRSSEVGVSLAVVLGLVSLICGENAAQSAPVFLLSSVAVQVLGDFLELFDRRYASIELSSESALLSTDNVKSILEKVEGIAGSSWVATIAVDRPEPKPAISIRLSHNEKSLTGLDVSQLSQVWRDFIDVLRTERGTIPGTEEVEGDDILKGMASQLGIGYACPIADAVGGSLTSLVLLLHDESESGSADAISVGQYNSLSDVLPELMRLSITLSYLSAECDIESVSNPRVISRTTPRVEPAEASPAMRPAFSETFATDVFFNEIVDAISAKPVPMVSGAKEDKTKAELALLHSQVQSLQNQQNRDYDLSEIELTQKQSEALDEIKAAGCPILLVGESGVGKHLLAMAAHQAMGGGAFFVINAAEVPESILALELFGSLEHFGLLRSAANGSLLIRGADRIPVSLFEDIGKVVEEMKADGENIRIFFSVDAQHEEFEWRSVHQDVSRCPQRFLDIAERFDADIVFVPSLREQEDAMNVATFFMHKRAMALEKPLSELPDEIGAVLSSYSWPGNFSELRSVIDCAVVRCEGTALTLDDLRHQFGGGEGAVSCDKKSEEDQIVEDKAEVQVLHGVSSDESREYREQMQFMQVLNETQQTQIETQQTRIETQKTQIETQKTQIETQKTQIETQQTRLEAQETQIETQQTQIESLKRRLEESQAETRAAITASQLVQAVKPAEISEAAVENRLFGGTFREVEHRLLIHVMRECGGDKEAAARRLGMKPETLLNKLGKHGLT